MKKTLLSIYCVLASFISFSQDRSNEYDALINKCFSLYSAKDYKNAAISATEAINLVGNKADNRIRKFAAFCWALADNSDSAFYQLNIIANLENLTFPDYVMIAPDGDFSSLHNDPRWKEVLEKIFSKARKTFYSLLNTSKGNATVFDLYNAAFAWSLNNNTDSSFYYLELAASSKNLTFDNVNTIIKNTTVFAPLLKDERWRINKEKMFSALYKKYFPPFSFSKSSINKPILVDEGHYNMHTLTSTYEILGGTFRYAGFKVSPHTEQFNASNLAKADLVIISNPHVDFYDSLVQRAQAANEPFRWSAAAAQPAYTNEEAAVIEKWVKNGGSLLLILDHAPNPTAGSPISEVFGIDWRNVATYDRLSRDPVIDTVAAKTILFTRSNKLIGKHPILNGVDSVTTYTGSSMVGPPKSEILLFLPSTATDRDWESTTQKFRDRSAMGRAQGIAFKWGKGKVVALGEAAMINPESTSRSDRGNWQMVLNIFRWLTGDLN